MKRTAAILGDTPPFVAWSIRKDCNLKCDIAINNPEAVESSLRAIRLASHAVHEDRIVDGYVFQIKNAHSVDKERQDDSNNISVFSLEEIAAAFGGWDEIQETCGSCPANVGQSTLNAGCFGWLSTDDFQLKILEEVVDHSQRCLMSAKGIKLTNPIWYGFWCSGELQGETLATTLNLFELVRKQAADSTQLNHFISAMKVCNRENLTIDLRSFPSGFSDGLTWSIASHCPDCRASQVTGSRSCTACGRSGAAHPLIKRKVRGLRPFVALDQRFEKNKAAQLRRLIEDKAISLEQNQD